MTYNVIVIGVGGMGSATCWQLARRGHRVLGLEMSLVRGERPLRTTDLTWRGDRLRRVATGDAAAGWIVIAYRFPSDFLDLLRFSQYPVSCAIGDPLIRIGLGTWDHAWGDGYAASRIGGQVISESGNPEMGVLNPSVLGQ